MEDLKYYCEMAHDKRNTPKIENLGVDGGQWRRGEGTDVAR